MPKFVYKAVLPSGRRISGVLTSPDRHDALCRLISKGHHPLEIGLYEENPPFWKNISRQSFRRVSDADLSVFTRQFSSLLKAGLPVLQALRTVRSQLDNTRLFGVIENIEGRLLNEGGTLSEAMEDYPHIFTAVYRGLVRAGEEGGNLAEVLERLADHLMKGVRLKRQVIAAFIYPMFLLVLGTAAVFILMAFVIPKFQELFQSFGGRLPMPTQVLIGISDFLNAWWWAVLLGGGGIGAVFLILLQYPEIRRQFDTMLLRLPLFGQMFLKIEISRLARTLGTLLANGVQILHALRITAQTVNNRALRGEFDRVIRDVSGGESLAAAFGRIALLPFLMINLLKTGEETGELPKMLGELSDIYDDESERAVHAVVKLLEPVLICMMGILITGIVIAVVLPILRANFMVE